MSSDDEAGADGLTQMANRRNQNRRSDQGRKTPRPRHNKPPLTTTGDSMASTDTLERPTNETSRETSRDTSREAERVTSHEGPRESVRDASREVSRGRGLPTITVDMDGPNAQVTKAVVMTVPASILERFNAARVGATSHMDLVLTALDAAGETLPDLVLARRGTPSTGVGLRALRAVRKMTARRERSEQLRIRPTMVELDALGQLVAWVAEIVATERPGGRDVTRSEVVTAALDKYLPIIATQE